MASEIVMPRMGLTMETGIIVHWLKQEGEAVKAGEPLLEIETDKATVEIEALESGTLGKIVAGVGDEVPVGAVIGYFQDQGEEGTPIPAGAKPSIPAMASLPTAANAASPATVSPASEKVRASPAARTLARKLSVELSRVQGSGPNGRVVAWNVQTSAEAAAKPASAGLAGRVSPVAQRIAAEMGVGLAAVSGTGPGGIITRRDVELAAQGKAKASAPETARSEEGVIGSVGRIQRIMAERMTQSFTTAPHFYLHTEVNARQLLSLREQLLPRLEQQDHVHITVTDLLLYFCGHVLPRHPLLMAQWAKDSIRHFERVNIGIAVETEDGLVVPVIQDVDGLGLVEIARRRTDLAERARQGRLRPEELEQGVFTISNLGMYRIDSFEAILNPPQAAILAVGQIKERAVVEAGQLVAAPQFNLSLSVDHRVLDGARAARFLSELADTIETPGLSMR